MDPSTINKAFNYITKRKKLILLLGAIGFTTYSAYKVYTSPSVINNRNKAIKILTALASATEFLGSSAETLTVISNDVKQFIQSDSDQIPCSLKQVFKITNSDEFTESVVKVTHALTAGILKGYRNGPVKAHLGPSFADRALDKLLSPAGTGFAAVVVGSFSRNIVMGIYADRKVVNGYTGSGDPVPSPDPVTRWVDVANDDKVRKLIGDCIQQFVTTMVTVYLDKTMDINTYDEILSSLTDPKHEEQVRDLMSLICNGAVETLVRTSHQVLTNSNTNGESNPCLIRRSSDNISRVFDRKELVLSKLRPRNIVGLTGRVTLATVKSFLTCLLSYLTEGVKTRFVEAYRYINAKSLVVMTVWVSLYLHMFSAPWSLMSV